MSDEQQDSRYVSRGEFNQFTKSVDNRLNEFSNRTDQQLSQIAEQVTNFGQAVQTRISSLDAEVRTQGKTDWNPIWAGSAAVIAFISAVGGFFVTNLQSDISNLDSNIEAIRKIELNAAKEQGRTEATLEALQQQINFLMSERSNLEIVPINESSPIERKAIINDLLNQYRTKRNGSSN